MFSNNDTKRTVAMEGHAHWRQERERRLSANDGVILKEIPTAILDGWKRGPWLRRG